MADPQQPVATPQDDAERIRLKRLAKLGGPSQPSSSSTSPAPSAPPSASATPAPKVQSLPKPAAPIPKPATPKRPSESPIPAATPPSTKKKQTAAPAVFDLRSWQHQTVQFVFKATLDKAVAEKSGYETVWLKYLADELTSEGIDASRLTVDIIDRVLIARLEIDPQNMTDDLNYLNVLASLPADQTVFEYLVGCWKRLKTARSTLFRKGYPPSDTETALGILDKIRDLLISYAGLTLQEPEMFPQPANRLENKTVGPCELVDPLLSLSALSASVYASTQGTNSPNKLASSDVEEFLQDLARRFEPDNEIDGVLGPVVRLLLFHPSLISPEGLSGNATIWRGILAGLEALVAVKPVAVMLTRMEEWNPVNANAQSFEFVSLLGPVCRLSVFSREYPKIAELYYANPQDRSEGDLSSAHASLRGTLKSLQGSLFQVFNAIVRASPESREAVLQYFARVISLNHRRSGTHVDMNTVSSDGFMLNLQCVLYRFAEPFMDATYSKIDRIDTLFFVNSDRIDIKEETRIKATSEEASAFEKEVKNANAPTPNFISNIFFLAMSMCHYGYLKTISLYEDLAKHYEDLKKHLDQVTGNRSWVGTPIQPRIEHAIKQINLQINKVKSEQLAYEAQLRDPDLVYKSIEFTNFLSTWLIRQVDPKKSHPKPTVELPLPQEVPMYFRTLPEYILEDIVDYLHFAVHGSPDKFDLAGKEELLLFVLTFLTSTWYIKNPFLKNKINDVLFMSIWGYGYQRNGILGNLLNSHPMALKHLMPALMQFYVEVEQTGASSQFYDKFNARRNIAYVLKVIWDNPIHREALSIEARNVDKFVRFVNLMINDVTYLLDESLNDLSQIHDIEVEMDNQEAWNSQTPDHRREREGTLRNLERHSGSYISLARSTVELLKIFTAETKEPFMMPEIVDRLAAMLDYNLHALVGPKCQNLRVKIAEKLRWDPKALLSDVIQVFLNLSDQQPFVAAVANDGRSYNKGIFETAASIAVRKTLKTEKEVDKLKLFVEKVEEYKLTMEAEEDFGEVPDEFLDPLMFSLMRDPVILPSSKTVIDRATIKSHLLSDAKDPFNRVPLKIEDVIPATDLKERIDAFILERRRKQAESRMDTAA